MFDKLRYIKDIRAELLNIEYNAKQIKGLTESQWVAIRASHRLLGKYLDALSKPSFSFNSDEQEQPEADLEKAAEEFAHNYDMGACDGIAQDCFKAGAEWQREHFKKAMK